jgi:hypothetical protein
VLCGLRSRRFSVRGACVGTALLRGALVVSVMADDDTAQVVPLIFRSDAEVEAFFDGEPLPEGAAPVERARRQRKATLASAIREATKAGKHVAGAVVEDGKVTLTFGEPGAGNGAATDVDRELAEFEARHEA